MSLLKGNGFSGVTGMPIAFNSGMNKSTGEEMPKRSYEIPSNPPVTDRKFRPEDENILEQDRREFARSESEKRADKDANSKNTDKTDARPEA